jgi:uncharacterized damage-inducible protein DinB
MTMDLLDRFLGHDAWVTRVLLDACEGLSDEQLDREFDIGLRSVRTTLDHMIFNMQVWTDRMDGLPARVGAGERARRGSIADLRARLDTAAGRFAQVARRVAADDDWDGTWPDTLEDPANEKSFGGTIAHVLVHNTHHRAHVLYMLRLLGVTELPDTDALYWEWLTGQK